MDSDTGTFCKREYGERHYITLPIAIPTSICNLCSNSEEYTFHMFFTCRMLLRFVRGLQQLSTWHCNSIQWKTFGGYVIEHGLFGAKWLLHQLWWTSSMCFGLLEIKDHSKVNYLLVLTIFFCWKQSILEFCQKKNLF